MCIVVGVTGSRCETKYSNCTDDDCANGAVCQDTDDGYRCLCRSDLPYYGERLVCQ